MTQAEVKGEEENAGGDQERSAAPADLAIEEQSVKFRQRVDQNLAEITDKLNGLIGYVAGQQPPPRK